MKLFARFVFRTVQVVPNLSWVFIFYFFVGPDRLEDYVFTVLEIELTWAGVIILAGAVALAFEIMKSTIFSPWAVFELMMSVVALLGGAFFILKSPPFMTETFLIIVMFEFIDVVIGAWVMVSVARRDIGFTPGGS